MTQRLEPADVERFPSVITIPVAWGDMDAFAHVNNARFFTYMESGRLAYFERMGLDRLDHGVRTGTILARAASTFIAPVRYPDTLRVGTRVVEVGVDRFTTVSAIASEEQARVVCVGTGVVVAYDHVEQRKIGLPDAWRSAIGCLEGPG